MSQPLVHHNASFKKYSKLHVGDAIDKPKPVQSHDVRFEAMNNRLNSSDVYMYFHHFVKKDYRPPILRSLLGPIGHIFVA